MAIILVIIYHFGPSGDHRCHDASSASQANQFLSILEDVCGEDIIVN